MALVAQVFALIPDGNGATFQLFDAGDGIDAVSPQ